ncbi:hypothetical protein JCM10213v2_004444 [Rhodosporidiobolus nylandii]
MANIVKPEPPLPHRRSALKRFNPKRISFFKQSSSSRTSVVSNPALPAIQDAVPPGHRLSSGERKAPPPSPIPNPAAPSLETIVFTLPFTNRGPSDSMPLPPPTNLSSLRRLSSEGRAIAANRAKTAVVAVETTPGKRRKSVVDLEEATEGVRTLSARRRSSLSPIQPVAGGRRPSCSHFTPCVPNLPESAAGSPSPVMAPSGVEITFPLTFPSVRSPVLATPASPLSERAAFTDEFATPTIPSPPPSTPASPRSTPASPPPPTCRSSATSLSARSPHAFFHLDLVPEDQPSSRERGHIRTPSGVRVNFPLVFPSPARRASSVVKDVYSDLDEAYNSDEAVEDAADSFTNFSFPRLPTLFPATPAPIPLVRRVSTSSSFHSPRSPDAVATPSTFELQAGTPLCTGFSMGGNNPFAEAFGRAGAVAASS